MKTRQIYLSADFPKEAILVNGLIPYISNLEEYIKINVGLWCFLFSSL
jgi:hypothetical protein